MFDKFGEMDSYEEINTLAENLFNEGDLESLKVMAEENGIPEDFTQMYIEGTVETLCGPVEAAMGKLDKECEIMKPQELMLDWVEYIRAQCMESDMIAMAVRRKGKTLEGCIEELLKWSFKHQQQIDQRILKKAGVNASKVTLGIPGMGTAKKIIKAYYLGK